VASGGGGGTGEEVRKVYAAVPLAKFPILKGGARWPLILRQSPLCWLYFGGVDFGRVAKGVQEKQASKWLFFWGFA
jgi:hypothetical protein